PPSSAEAPSLLVLAACSVLSGRSGVFLAASQDAIVSTIGRTVDVELRKILDRLAAAIVLYLILVYTAALLWDYRRLQRRHHFVLALSPLNDAWNRSERGRAPNVA